ncbi:alpha/beta-hydrolase [Fomitiporia mediterranea MF3/22]|uniref:alpha/beta-hydrolase n=1 Tax=Fomitiporia mediterranea (strain MF3/22) TaxID=694068 RepID=UPI00044086C4|nr:alpha/beta-hydrolase [Fomitiporia mediterranea MF3/22]EJD03416.1 alpha/beta-hydrolase [Fomitiporia mediterranea MF3/22]
MSQSRILSTQPFKGIYVTYSLLGLVLVRVPYWTVCNLLSSWRPRKSWSLARCLQVNFVRFMMIKLGVTVGGLEHTPTHKALELGKGVEGIWIDGTPELITGDLKKWADIAGVEPVKIPGYWEHKPGTRVTMGELPYSGEKVLLALHGGGYIMMSAHPSCVTSGVQRKIMEHSFIRRAFSVEYRLAAPGENPFPAQLIDALAGYAYLVRTVGFKPEDIILVGDSAGGNLALALTRYLVTHASSLDPQLAIPGGMILLSPWVDLTTSHLTPGSSTSSSLHLTIAFVGPHGSEFLAHPYISPATRLNPDISFEDFPRTLIVLGDAEIFADAMRTLREYMVEDMGTEEVRLYEAKDAFHDFMVFDFCEPQRTQAAIVIAKWIKAL